MKAKELVMYLLDHIADCDGESEVEFYVNGKTYIITYFTESCGFALKEVKEDAK